MNKDTRIAIYRLRQLAENGQDSDAFEDLDEVAGSLRLLLAHLDSKG